jgi:hypothetical protein
LRGAKRRARRALNPCRVYWASHGCKKHRDHAGIHVCECGDRLESWMPTYGEDARPGPIEHRLVHAVPPRGWDAEKYPPGPCQ